MGGCGGEARFCPVAQAPLRTSATTVTVALDRFLSLTSLAPDVVRYPRTHSRDCSLCLWTAVVTISDQYQSAVPSARPSPSDSFTPLLQYGTTPLRRSDCPLSNLQSSQCFCDRCHGLAMLLG